MVTARDWVPAFPPRAAMMGARTAKSHELLDHLLIDEDDHGRARGSQQIQ